MTVKIIECPRDAMQGIHDFIPTERKIAYINALLKVGFDTLDFGSFVSERAIPQMRDTEQVLKQLDFSLSKSKLLAIVANRQGVDRALGFEEISYLGFPFSISETFQIRNTNSTIEEALLRVDYLQNACVKKGKEPVIYISMGFGNPYGDPWNAEVVAHWVEVMHKRGVKILSLSDTVGVANPESISYLFSHLISEYPTIEFGAHLHTRPESWREKVLAAYQNGCRRFDGALKGYGGCPMAADTLTGNMPTENLMQFMREAEEELFLNEEAFGMAMLEASKTFL